MAITKGILVSVSWSRHHYLFVFPDVIMKTAYLESCLYSNNCHLTARNMTGRKPKLFVTLLALGAQLLLYVHPHYNIKSPKLNPRLVLMSFLQRWNEAKAFPQKSMKNIVCNRGAVCFLCSGNYFHVIFNEIHAANCYGEFRILNLYSDECYLLCIF